MVLCFTGKLSFQLRSHDLFDPRSRFFLSWGAQNLDTGYRSKLSLTGDLSKSNHFEAPLYGEKKG